MPDWALYKEAYERGILSEDQKLIYEEAIKRGLVDGIPSQMDTIETKTLEAEVPEWGRKNPNLYGAYGAGKELFSQAGKPVLEGIGLAAGGLAGGVPGAALGYGMMKKTGDIIEKGIDYIGGEDVEKTTIPQEMIESGKDVLEGATIEMGGKVLGETVIPKVVSTLEKAGSQVVGKLTGAGEGAASQAFKSGKAGGETFKRAMRGEITGQEVVDMAKDSLGAIKDQRSIAYRKSLDIITKNSKPINLEPVHTKLESLMKQYNIKSEITPDGKVILNTKRIAMGKKGIRDIKEIINKVAKWGDEPEDFTAKGLDILKRQLDDFYSDSSQARQFVASMRKTVRETIVKDVPEYGKMTKAYEEATSLIKDIESNLMLRKQGMSGRIVSDQTLRRLTSAMKDNFELRRELVGILTDGADKDVLGAVAGYSMKTFVPRGLAGTGPALVGNVALAKLATPWFWPVVAMSSPRVAGEFLSMLGKAAAQMPGASVAAGRAIAYTAGKNNKIDYIKAKVTMLP